MAGDMKIIYMDPRKGYSGSLRKDSQYVPVLFGSSPESLCPIPQID